MKFDHTHGSEVIDCYNNYNNYKIIENNSKNNAGVTVVYFSSNGIYFPNTHNEFKKVITNNNRYEWSKIENQFENVNKIIFVRDVFKQWYLKGINKDINNFDKLAKFIKDQHKEERLVLIGSSAGGYAATIIGCMLNADMVFSFAGQLTLNNILKNAKDKLVIELYSENKYYYNLERLIEKSNINIAYFVCKHSSIDKYDIEIASKCSNIYKFYFDCDSHGVPFSPVLLKKVLSLEVKELKNLSIKYEGKLINKSLFINDFLTRIEYSLLLSKYVIKYFNKVPKYILRKVKDYK